VSVDVNRFLAKGLCWSTGALDCNCHLEKNDSINSHISLLNIRKQNANKIKAVKLILSNYKNVSFTCRFQNFGGPLISVIAFSSMLSTTK